ncbi:MAG: hypothetical protein WCA04_10565 [Geobacteraceae bacterium]
MKKLLVALVVASILTAVVAAPVFAHGWGRTSRGEGEGVNLLWPITAALVIPAAIIGAAQLRVPVGVRYSYAPPPVPVEPDMYSRPAPYSPRVYYPTDNYRGHGCGR